MNFLCRVLGVYFAVSFFIVNLSFAYNPLHLEKFKTTHRCIACDFNELNLSDEILGSDDYQEAILKGTYMYGSNIEHLKLNNLNAEGLIGLGLMLHDNDLSYADFSYADLPNLKVSMWNRGEYTNFTGATLDEANFSFTHFEAPQMTQASLSHAVLYHISWPNAALSGARLRYANLTYAQLQGADLSYANLTDALLSHADLTHANLWGAQVTEAQLATAASLCNAILPDGSLGGCFTS